MNYLLRFVFCFSFPPESLLLKDYCDERYTRRSWGPRLIAGTPGESQENSRGTWGPSLSNVQIATLNCHCICCLGNKASAFSEIPEASWTVLRWCCSWGPCEKSAVYQPVFSTCQLPLDHTHPQDMDSLLQIFSPRPPSFFFYCLIPSLQVAGFQHLHNFHLTNTSSEKLPVELIDKVQMADQVKFPKGACNSPGSRKHMAIEFKHPKGNWQVCGDSWESQHSFCP